MQLFNELFGNVLNFTCLVICLIFGSNTNTLYPKATYAFLPNCPNSRIREIRYISSRVTTTSGLSTTWQKNVVLSCTLPCLKPR